MRRPILDMSRFMDSSERASRIVEDRFDQSVSLMRFTLEKSLFRELKLPFDCFKLPQLHSVEQRFSQDLMRDMCESIQHNVAPGYDYNVIEFAKDHQEWNGQGFSLVETAVTMKLVGCNTEWNYIDEAVGNNITIFIRDGKKKNPVAVLKSTGADGVEYFFELEEFSLLSFTISDSFDENSMTQEMFRDNLTSIFTFFDRNRNILFVDNASLTIKSLLEELKPMRII